jgi:hypothetical protein
LERTGRTSIGTWYVAPPTRLGVGLRPAALERGVHDPLGDLLLAVGQHLVDELGDELAAVDRVDFDRTLRGGAFAWHQLFSFFVP